MKIGIFPMDRLFLKPNDRAFTLIEMVMVIVIVGILTAVAIPRFSSFYAIKLDGVAKKLVSDIRYVQQIAVAEHVNTRIVFNSAVDTYTAYKEVSPSGSGNWIVLVDPFTRRSLNPWVNFVTDPKYQGINILSVNFGGTPTLRFDWQGVPQDGNGANLSADGSVTLDYQDNSSTIYVTPNTGRVRVQ
jgi:prepilin-type N-terminal cleavage/methylation domain-containing protein